MWMIGLITRAVLVLVAQSEIHEVPIDWRIAPGVSCPTLLQLEAAYRRQDGIEPDALRPGLMVALSVDRPSKDTLHLELSTTPPVFEARRDIVAGGSNCAELAETIALLLSAWLRGLPEMALEPLTLTDSAPTAQGQLEPTFVAPSEGKLTAVHVVGARTETESGFGLALYLGADAYVNASTAGALTVGAAVNLSERVGIEAIASFMQALTVQDSAFGSIDVQRQLFGGLAMIGLWRPPPKLPSFDALGGLVLWHGAAQSSGYPTSLGRELFDPGLMIGGRAQQRLWKGVWLQGQVAIIGLYRAYDLQVTTMGGEVVTPAVLQRFALDVSVGVHVRIF
jgi:hypothetical protein